MRNIDAFGQPADPDDDGCGREPTRYDPEQRRLEDERLRRLIDAPQRRERATPERALSRWEAELQARKDRLTDQEEALVSHERALNARAGQLITWEQEITERNERERADLARWQRRLLGWTVLLGAAVLWILWTCHSTLPR